MSVALRQFFRFSLATIFLVGVTVQLLPTGMAMTDTSSSATMQNGCEQPLPPCPDRTPNCIDHFGCLSVPALPLSPASLAAPFRWTVIAYASGTATLPGLSLKPELCPPIPAA